MEEYNKDPMCLGLRSAMSKSGLMKSHSMNRMGALSQTRSIGEAFDATKAKNPEWNFGTSVRPPLNPDDGNPGPGSYQHKSVVGQTVTDSRVRTAPNYSLRSREKFGDPSMKAVDPTTVLEPGPGHYRPKKIPRERNAPQFSFPKALPPHPRDKFAPGPGQYHLPASVASKQVLSTMKSVSVADFGTSTRPPLLVVSSEVGPGHYESTVNACSKQTDSRKKSSANMKFGTGGRHIPAVGAPIPAKHAPGPGDYQLAPALCGSGAAYIYNAAPRCSMSGRNKFGSPW